MSKMGSYVLEMQEAAQYMTRYAFERAYGSTQLYIWDEVNMSYPEVDYEVAYVGC
jgi:hypothetical protein